MKDKLTDIAKEKSPDNYKQESIDARFKEIKGNKGNTKKTCVLIVEDDEDIREVLCFQLSQEGYKVITASDGHQGLKLAGAYLPSIILMDINMPRLDGISACSFIKNNDNPALKKIPIIMLTAQGHEKAVISAANAGADGYIIKPFEIEYVIEKIEQLLKQSKRAPLE